MPNLEACAKHGVALIEQPLPAGEDAILAEIPHPVPICADESCHDARDLAGLRGRYDAVNVKLDKAGGLTAALALVAEAERLGFEVMIGSMVGTSLGVAPALLLAGKLGLDEQFPPVVTTYWRRLRDRDGYRSADAAQIRATAEQNIDLTNFEPG